MSSKLAEIKLPPELADWPRKGDPGYEEWLERKKLEAPWSYSENNIPHYMTGATRWLDAAKKYAPVPETVLIPVKYNLDFLLDGIMPKGLEELEKQIVEAGEITGWPMFLRTDYTSGKHDWKSCCGNATGPEKIGECISALVNWSAIIDVPVTAFMARKMIPTSQIFTAFNGMPITREFRLFARNGEIYHVQPYWPEEAFSDRDADLLNSGGREKLLLMSVMSETEFEKLAKMTVDVAKELPQTGWSVDWLQDTSGKWWLTDMAVDSVSYKWEPDFAVVSNEMARKAAETGFKIDFGENGYQPRP